MCSYSDPTDTYNGVDQYLLGNQIQEEIFDMQSPKINSYEQGNLLTFNMIEEQFRVNSGEFKYLQKFNDMGEEGVVN